MIEVRIVKQKSPIEIKVVKEHSINVEVYPFGDQMKSEYPDYTGSYQVIPRAEPQTLQTAQKVLRSNIEVQEVPYLEVTNPQGGYTAIIAYL